MRAVIAAIALAACSKEPAPDVQNAARAAEPDEGAWRCFVADPGTPKIAAGNVTHLKERLVGDRFETANVNVRDGVTRVSRFEYRKVGDHFESKMGEGMLTLRMLEPDGSRRVLHYEDASGWEFSDELAYDDHGMAITSTDYDATGKPVKTVVRHLRAPCYVVDAELAKHPAD